jgi:hypothetical protein
VTLKITTELAGNKGNIYALNMQGTPIFDAPIDDVYIVVMETMQTIEDREMVGLSGQNKEISL